MWVRKTLLSTWFEPQEKLDTVQVFCVGQRTQTLLQKGFHGYDIASAENLRMCPLLRPESPKQEMVEWELAA